MTTLAITLDAAEFASIATLANVTESTPTAAPVTRPNLLDHVHLTISDPITGAWSAIATDRYAIAEVSGTSTTPPTNGDAEWDAETAARLLPANGVTIAIPAATLIDVARGLNKPRASLARVAITVTHLDDPEFSGPSAVYPATIERSGLIDGTLSAPVTAQINGVRETMNVLERIRTLLAQTFAAEGASAEAVGLRSDILARLAKVLGPDQVTLTPARRNHVLAYRFDGPDRPVAVIRPETSQRIGDIDWAAEHTLRMAIQPTK